MFKSFVRNILCIAFNVPPAQEKIKDEEKVSRCRRPETAAARQDHALIVRGIWHAGSEGCGLPDRYDVAGHIGAMYGA